MAKFTDSILTTKVLLDDAEGLITALRKNRIVWCWGAHKWSILNNKAIRFHVNGRLFKGIVFLTVNGLDLFDIYFTDEWMEIKHEAKNVYLDTLIETIDDIVETPSAL